VQIIAFSFMLLLLAQFTAEFSMAGFPYSVDLWGTSWSQLAGVVLFNYAYIVTVPLWLAEKKNDVNINHIVWGASTMSSLIYVGTCAVVGVVGGVFVNVVIGGGVVNVVAAAVVVIVVIVVVNLVACTAIDCTFCKL
jgi:hypothetical protein